ncbi:MAG: hypothetical protein GC145_03615 [Caulobacter sp.]|nr:hypothetical protein [Caulobacter sp.]
MTDSLLEVRNLAAFLSKIESRGSKNNALVELAVIFGEVIGEEDPSKSYRDLLGSLDRIEEVASERALGSGYATVLRNVIADIRDLVGLKASQYSYGEFIQGYKGQIKNIRSTFPILMDLQYDENALISRAPDIISELQKFKSRISTHDDVNDNLRVVLFAQVDLMEKSLTTLTTKGVGSFRHSVFTAFGRIVLELKSDPNIKAGTAKEIVDDFLRVYGIMEAAGSLLSLGAPVIAGLLSAPAS